MAIRRAGGAELDYPGATTTLEQGDRLLIVGESNELAAFDELAKGEAAVPAENASCQWIQVLEDSTIVCKTLAELDWRRQYKIQIQAIRRENKFLRFPADDVDVQAGDRLLLCGSFYALNQATTSISPKLELSISADFYRFSRALSFWFEVNDRLSPDNHGLVILIYHTDTMVVLPAHFPSQQIARDELHLNFFFFTNHGLNLTNARQSSI